MCAGDGAGGRKHRGGGRVDAAAFGVSLLELRGLGISADAYRCDVSQADQMNRMISAVVDRFGRINVVVNDAGIHDSKSL